MLILVVEVVVEGCFEVKPTPGVVDALLLLKFWAVGLALMEDLNENLDLGFAFARSLASEPSSEATRYYQLGFREYTGANKTYFFA